MTTTPIVEVDLVGITNKAEVHERLSMAFGFPGHCGKNWDAFWDCITTLETKPQTIRIHGLKGLQKDLPNEAVAFMKCLQEYISTPEGANVTLDIA